MLIADIASVRRKAQVRGARQSDVESGKACLPFVPLLCLKLQLEKLVLEVGQLGFG